MATTKFIFTPMDFELFGVEAVLVISSFIIFLLLLALFLLLYRTKFGIALRASMENPTLAEIMGVDVEHTRLFSWFLSGSLAAVAGSMLPFRQEIVPLTGTIIIVSIFAASVVGGLSSIYGALVGGYVIGISESLVTFYLRRREDHVSLGRGWKPSTSHTNFSIFLLLIYSHNIWRYELTTSNIS